MDAAAFFDFLLHAEVHLKEFMEHYGIWVYALVFLIVFCETGLVVTPFLPGDSLLFALGAMAAQGMLDPLILLLGLFIAAVLGDSVNYAIGKWCGPKVFTNPRARWLRVDYLQQAHAFYEKYGGRAIILARFIPIVRTFAPFVAGIGTMEYRRFFFYNVIGAALWIGLFIGAGYLFGNLPWVKSNLKIVILGIIIFSVLPLLWEWMKSRRRA
jgi:membrane-associated protein